MLLGGIIAGEISVVWTEGLEEAVRVLVQAEKVLCFRDLSYEAVYLRACCDQISRGALVRISTS